MEASQVTDVPKPKPALGPKPRLAPKPFSLQKNTTIRSIHAPKTVTTTPKTTQQSGKSEATAVPRPTLPTPASQPITSKPNPSSVSVLAGDQAKTTTKIKVGPHGEDTPDSTVVKSAPAQQTAPATETSKSAPLQKDDIIQTNLKAPSDVVTKPEETDGNKEDDKTLSSVIQKLEEPKSDISSAANPTYGRGSTRKRLSMELTSKFESGGLSLPPQPHSVVTISTTSTQDDVNKPEFSNPQPSQTTSEPSNHERDDGGAKEDYSGGGSIKRRISLLFDSSSRPEVPIKREEPEILNGTGGVKARIRNWASETSSEGPKTERKSQFVPRLLSKSFEPATPPAAEKAPKMPPAEPPATETTSSEAVDLPSTVAPAEQPTSMQTSKDALTQDESSESHKEAPAEHVESKIVEGGVQLRSHSRSAIHTVTGDGDSAASEEGLKRDSVKRRSVHFGVVERDDGGPPLILGSSSDSSEEEEEGRKHVSEDEAEEDITVSVPVYRRVAISQRDDRVHEQEAERLKHLEFDNKRRVEESEELRLKLEEDQNSKEDKEREEKKARFMEAEERGRERMKEEEMQIERKKEWERERLEEDRTERERLQEEEMEREQLIEQMLQKQREEERQRAEQMEEQLRHDQEEREQEILREEERLREERERLREKEEEEERLIHENEDCKLEVKLREEGVNKKKQREEEWEKEWVAKTARLGGEEEEKELELMQQRQKEEDRERAQQVEEILKQEEREKERLRQEAEERERRRRLREEQEEMERRKQIELQKQQEEERREAERVKQIDKERAEELERKMQEELERRKLIELEKQQEEERREAERAKQIDKERAEELERKMQEELERRQLQELQERLRAEKETGRDGLTNREGESAESQAEPNLINFDSDDVPPQSSYSPAANIYESTESEMEVVYEDFSVRQPRIEVEFDDFSVKPRRWGSQAKKETCSVIQSEPAYPAVEGEVDVSTWEYETPEQVEDTDSHKPTLAQKSEEKEEQLISISMELEVKEEENEKEEETEKEEEEEENNEEKAEVEGEDPQEDEVRENAEKEAQGNSYCTNSEDKDTDALIDNEPDQPNEACEPTAEIDSPQHVPEHDVPSQDGDTTDFHRVAELTPFPESPTPLLDISAQKSKADLGKRRIRTRPSRSLRAGLSQRKSPDWRTRDSSDETDASHKRRESDSEDEQPTPKIVCSPPPTSQRVPIFPGLSPAALIAQIKRRTVGGGAGGGEETEEVEEREEKESENEAVTLSTSQLSSSPRPPAHLAGAARVLPPLSGTDGGSAACPAWLKELKSKKRLSQYDGEA